MRAPLFVLLAACAPAHAPGGSAATDDVVAPRGRPMRFAVAGAGAADFAAADTSLSGRIGPCPDLAGPATAALEVVGRRGRIRIAAATPDGDALVELDVVDMRALVDAARARNPGSERLATGVVGRVFAHRDARTFAAALDDVVLTAREDAPGELVVGFDAVARDVAAAGHFTVVVAGG